MVLDRRHWKFLLLPLILVLILTACERPLASNDNDSADESAEATAVAETTGSEDEAVADDDAVEPADSVEESDAEAGDGEAEVETAAEEGDAAGAETEEAEEAEPADADAEAGGGTPDTAAEDAAAEESDAESTTDAESADGEQAEAGSADTTEEAAAAAGSDTSAEDASAEDAAAEDASAEDAGQTAEAQSASTLPATHTVAPGENLYRIGLKYGMSWVTLAAYNNLPNANYIRVGQVLNIPGGGPPPPTTPPPTPPDVPGSTNYVVQPGDTLNSIGRKFGVSWVEIAEANGIVNPNLIYAGQVLKIPTSQPEQLPSLTHVVKPGETLNRISLQYGVHWLAIAQTNNIVPPYIIYPGQVLVIPSG